MEAKGTRKMTAWHMDEVDVLFKEYEALRGEVLGGLQSRNTIVSIGLAAMGLMWIGAVGLVSADPKITSLVLAFGVPTVAMCFLFVWYGEYRRVQKAGRYLYGLESKINERAGAVLLNYETERRDTHEGERYWFDPIVTLFCLIVLLSGLVGQNYRRAEGLRWQEVVWYSLFSVGVYSYIVYRIGRLRKEKAR